MYDLCPGSYDFFGLNCYTSSLVSNDDVQNDTNGGGLDMNDVGVTYEKHPTWPQ